MSFVKFEFSQRQIKTYYQAAMKSFKIASKYEETTITFTFCYDALIKIAISICAHNGLRVKARAGHHIELIKKLSAYLEDDGIFRIGDKMRIKRNKDVYNGGILVSQKEAKEYLDWLRSVIAKSDAYFNKQQLKLKV